MNIAGFFIDRPVFAVVLSIATVLLGSLAGFSLGIERHPPIVPPSVVISTTYPGANAQTVADTVSTPIEQQVNGVENMLYMSSQSTNDGTLQITVTFALGTNLDVAQVQVQNRVSIAEPTLPEEVRRQGIVVRKSSNDLLMFVNMVSPDARYDRTYLSNYALITVRDQLLRLPGISEVVMVGARDYSMRVWLDPGLLAVRNLTVTEVMAAIRAQNVQVAAGVIGQPPTAESVDVQLTVRTQGRLLDPEAFGDIIVKRGEAGQLTRMRDIARIELGAINYLINMYLDNAPVVGLGVYLLPDANALEAQQAVYRTMKRLSRKFPKGLEYKIRFDPTVFVQQSIEAVATVFLEAALIVLLVVLVFLQNWRATLIPMLSVPVSIIGTFAVMAALGISLNTISLMAMVLAIGIVVDDAIVVVENVERNLEAGLDRLAATRAAMREVTSPVIATAVVLSSVFIPTAFVSGITGQFYHQFAVTIASATVISSLNSLTLSPALAAILLHEPGHPRDRFQRLLDAGFGRVFRGFNAAFGALRSGYLSVTRRLIRRGVLAVLLYAGLLGLTGYAMRAVPTGFLPPEDQGYLLVFVQLPDAASLHRTDQFMHELSRRIGELPGIGARIHFAGWSAISRSSQSNVGTMFINLKEFDERARPELHSDRIAARLRQEFGGLQDALVQVFQPPLVRGLGTVGGFKLQVQDRADRGLEALAAAARELIDAGNADPQLANLFTAFRANVPQVYLDIDRTQARHMGLALDDVFETLRVYLGSAYVNDFNRFGRVFRVTAQADTEHRSEVDDIRNLKTRNAAGQMVPLGAIVSTRDIAGPDRLVRYNLFPAVEVTGAGRPGVSSGEALAAVERIADTALPSGFGFEWTELSLQQKQAGNTALFVFPLCVVFVFLALAAQYESWSLPFSVILIVPMCLLSALGGLALFGLENNIMTQVCFIVLVGLACKNAILIVQFAKLLQDGGSDRYTAAVEAARLRLRPILMTSFAFIFGVLPLALASGAGAETRQAIGIAAMSGMLGVTLFGLLFTPVFYVLIRKLIERRAAPISSQAGK